MTRRREPTPCEPAFSWFSSRVPSSQIQPRSEWMLIVGLVPGPATWAMIASVMGAPVSPGEVLAGKYRVERVLGEGGMGVVVAATDTQLERKVAIKFLLPDYAEHHEAAQRFLREARAAVKIQSEHVARVIDVGTMENGAPYMVMEYLEGRDLAGVFAGMGNLPVQEAVAYVLEACDAIAEAHSVGIVHRDLKPANLFLARQPDGSSRIKVLDFGISKAMMTTTGMDPALTRTSSMMGSPLYMSPEQMRSAKHVDPRTDVWALGVILYEALVGAPPFYAESIPELSAKVLLEDVPSMCSKRPEVPQELDAVVRRALAKDPGARYPTVADFAVALLPFAPARSRVNVERATRVLRLVGTDGTVPAGASPVTRGMAAYSRTADTWGDSKSGVTTRRNKMWVGLAAGGVLLVGGAAFVIGRVVTPRTTLSPESPTLAAHLEPPAAPVVPKTEEQPAVVPTVAASVSPPAAPSASAVPAAATATVAPAPRPRPRQKAQQSGVDDFGSRK